MRQIARVILIGTLGLGAAGCVSKSDSNKPQLERAAEINLEIGIEHLRKGNLAQAKEKIERSLEQNPRSAKANMTAGLLYDRLGDYRKADSHFDRAIALDGKNPDIANNYAVFLCKNGRHERGEKYALQAATDPLYATPEIAWMNAGNCARAKNDLTRAEQHYRKALAARPRLPIALFSLAEVQLEQKNYLSARGFLEQYLTVARTSPATLWLGVRIERALGNEGTAKQYAQRLKNEFPKAPETKLLLESERNSG
ncbi:MAG TPA: type IV pilus biogenesis/stability protein PilW [Steroidobacteraceae bacterium]